MAKNSTGVDIQCRQIIKDVTDGHFSPVYLLMGDEPYYPVNDEKNGALYAKYKALADAETKVIFGGRLGEYKYYDMDKVIEAALDAAARELG